MAFVFSKVGICVLVVGYLLLGAFAFQAIEAPAEAEIKYNVKEFRNETGSVFSPQMIPQRIFSQMALPRVKKFWIQLPSMEPSGYSDSFPPFLRVSQ